MQNKHSFFFGSLVIFRSHLPPFVDWGGRGQKRQPGRGDFEEVVRPAYPAYPRNPAYLYM